MFWGLVLEPSKRYTQKVQQSFHISQASLELSTSDLEPIQLILEYDGANYVLATLSKKSNIYQVPLDLNFNAGDQISFRTIGKGRVHLTGYHILEDDLEDMMLNGEEESDVDEEEETDNSVGGKQQTKRKKPDSSKSPSNKKSKLNATYEVEGSDGDSDEDTFGGDDSDLGDSEDEEVDEEAEEDMELDGEDEDDDEEESEEEEEEEEDEEEVVVTKKAPASASKNNKADASMNGKPSKNKKIPDSTKETPKPGKKSPGTPGKDMKENKTPKSEKKSPKSEKKANQVLNKSQESSPQKKVLEGGVIVEELRVGEGQVAKPGRMAQVYYVGRLQSTKKQFDATTQGPGFKFRLGRGEVIKGWDIGVNGMKVGGKRRITIPAQLAYGVRGSPPAIPPNSTLVFEVELKGLN